MELHYKNTFLWVLPRRTAGRSKEMMREMEKLERVSQGGRVIRVQWAAWVIKRHGGKQWTGADHVYTVSRLWNHKTQHRSAGSCVCLSFWMFALCVCGPHEWRCVTEWDWRASKFLLLCGDSSQLFTFPCFYSETHTQTLPDTYARTHARIHT